MDNLTDLIDYIKYANVKLFTAGNSILLPEQPQIYRYDRPWVPVVERKP